MIEDPGEEYELTDEQFEEIMKESISELMDKMILFAKNPKETYHEIAKEYKLIYDSYKAIHKGYRRRKKMGIDVVPTVRFDHEAGTMRPGFRNKSAISNFNKWYKILKGKNHSGMVR